MIPAGAMVPCSEHGDTAWCFVMDDGSHRDSDECRCLQTINRDCPVHGDRTTIDYEADNLIRAMKCERWPWS